MTRGPFSRIHAAAVALVAAAGGAAGQPEPPGPVVPRADHPGYGPTSLPGTEALDVIFIVDGSGSIAAPTFSFSKDVLRSCIETFPPDGTVAVAVIQFASTAVTEIPLTVLDATTAQQILDDLDAIEQIEGGTLLRPPLDIAFDMLELDAAGDKRRVFIVTDGGIGDCAAAEERSEELRTMPQPVTICAAIVGLACPHDDECIKNCANVCDAATFNPDQPIGNYQCADEAADFAMLCELCLPSLLMPEGGDDCDGDGTPDAFELDCDANSVPDECESPGGFCDAAESGKLFAPQPAANDLFGFSVAVEGDVLVASAPDADGACPGDPDCNSGAAWVYAFDGSAWNLQAALTASDAAGGDRFGYAVAVHDDTVVIGAPEKSTQAGAAYVFQRDEGGPDAWGQVTRLLPQDPGPSQLFGTAVSVSCLYAVVGSPGTHDDGVNSGSAYVFRRDGGGLDNWGQVAKLTATDAESLDEFGTSVSLDGDVCVIGAPGDEVVGPNPGAAYVFRRFVAPDVWKQWQKLEPEGGTSGDFGQTVSVSGQAAVVGSMTAFCCGPSAFAFRFNGEGWMAEEVLTDIEDLSSDGFGTSVDMAGDLAVIGARNNSEIAPLAGAAYAWRYVSGEWSEIARLRAADAAFLDEFGTSVAASGATAAIGSPGDDFGSVFQAGSVYVMAGAGDCNDNLLLDTCDIASGTSSDDDGDGVPDECLPLCCGGRIRVSQESAPGAGDFEDNDLGCLEPYVAPSTAFGFYAYDVAGRRYDGAYFCSETADRSHILFAETSNGLTLFVVHDRAVPDDPDGGRAEMRFTLSGDGDGVARTVLDDQDDFYTGLSGGSEFTSGHAWAPDTTDGTALSGLDGSWSMLVSFAETDGNGATAPLLGLQDWHAVSADGTAIELAPDLDRRVRFTVAQSPCVSCAWDCQVSGGGPDGVVGINDFLDLLIQWEQQGVSCDLGLGAAGVGIEELLDMLLHWGPCP